MNVSRVSYQLNSGNIKPADQILGIKKFSTDSTAKSELKTQSTNPAIHNNFPDSSEFNDYYKIMSALGYKLRMETDENFGNRRINVIDNISGRKVASFPSTIITAKLTEVKKQFSQFKGLFVNQRV